MGLLEKLKIIYFFLALGALFSKRTRLLFILISFEFIILRVLVFRRLNINFTMFVFVLVTAVISSVIGLLVLLGSLRIFGNDRSVF